jgi:hypothetical protein
MTRRLAVAPFGSRAVASKPGGPLLRRVSDAGRLKGGAACSAVGVRKPPKEPAMEGT